MNILAGVASLNRGGSERVVSLLTQEWAQTHHLQVVVFQSVEKGFNVGGELISLNAPPAGTVFGKWFQFRDRVKQIQSMLKDLKPDKIITFGESANLPFLRAVDSLGMGDRLTVSVHAFPNDVHPRYHRWMRKWYPKAGEIIVVGKELEESLKSFLGNSQANIRHIPNPVALEQIGKEEITQNRVHNNSFILGMGRLEIRKGFDLLIEAYAQIQAKIKEDLLIVGSGKLKSELQKLVTRRKLQNRVIFIPNVSNPFDYLRQANVFVLSSRSEGWGLVLAEALACETPTAAFDCPVGPRQILDGGTCGILVPNGDVTALGHAVLELLQNDHKRQNYIQHGLEKVREYDVKILASKWLETHAVH